MMLSCGHSIPDLAFVLLVDESGELPCPVCQRSAIGSCEAAGEQVDGFVWWWATWIMKPLHKVLLVTNDNAEA